MTTPSISSISDIRQLVSRHEKYRAKCLNLIASENVVSVSSRRLLSSDLVGRYATYLDDPAIRNYTGNKYIAELELAVLDLAKKLFQADFVDLRPLGGELAVKAIFTGLASPGDMVFESGPTDGGHGVGRRMFAANLFKNILDLRYIPIKDYELDPDMSRFQEVIREQKPKLIVFGRSRILFPEPIEQVREAADEVGAYIAYDASHIMGLIAGKVFPNPLDQGADVVAGSTAKTLGAPQGGIIFTRNEDVYKQVRTGFYPSLITNHHINRIPGIAATLLEMLTFGEAYFSQVVRNSRSLGGALYERGFDVLARDRGFSQSHEVLVDVSRFGNGREINGQLELAGIFMDGVTLPIDIKTGGKTASGLRMGTQEITRTGAVESDMEGVADLIKRVVFDKEKPETVADDVAVFVSRFDHIKYTFDEGATPYTPVF